MQFGFAIVRKLFVEGFDSWIGVLLPVSWLLTAVHEGPRAFECLAGGKVFDLVGRHGVLDKGVGEGKK